MGEVPEMVERVAKAIYEGRNGPGCEPWARRRAPYKEPYRKDALAAIAAMREPNDAMRLAAYEAVEVDERWDIADDERWAKSYRAGIDAALPDPVLSEETKLCP